MDGSAAARGVHPAIAMAIASALARTSPDTRASGFGFVLGCNLVGFLSALVPGGNHAAYYRSLELPGWAPPSQIYAPMWMALYTLMGVATYLVWRDSTGEPRRAAMTAFAVQLALNAAWTPIFFGLHWIGLAFVVNVFVLGAVTMMGILYRRVRPSTTALVAPLWLWVAFAATLNGAIWLLN